MLIDARTGKRRPYLGGARQLGAGRDARAADPAGAQPPRGPPLRRRPAQAQDGVRPRDRADVRRSGRCATGARRGSKAINARRASMQQGLPPAPARRRRAREPRPRLGLHGRQPRARRPGRCCTCATQAFAALGDRDLADLKPEGRSPAFAITADDADAPRTRRSRAIVAGTVSVPCYLQNAGCAVGARLQPRRRRAAGAEARQHLRGAVPLRDPARRAGRRRPRAALRPRPARQPARLRRLGPGAAQDARAPAGLHRLRHLLERALGRQRRRGHRPGRRGDPGPLEVRRDHRPAPAGHAQHALPRPRDGGRGRVPRAPAFAGAFDASSGCSTTATRRAGSRAARSPRSRRTSTARCSASPGMNYSTLLQRSVDFAPFRALLERRYTEPARPDRSSTRCSRTCGTAASPTATRST